MNIPISNRLLLCADMIPRGARVADIGTDHGYLPIWLIQNGRARHVIAADLRQGPLENAIRNAKSFGLAEQIEFRLSDGLQGLRPEEADAIVCAGMGGDLIFRILDACSWAKHPRYTFVLQPQRTPQDLRRRLCESGFGIEREALAQDAGFIYPVLQVRYSGRARTLTPGEQYLSPALQKSGDPLLPVYLRRVRAALRETVDGLARADVPRPERLAAFSAALKEIEEMTPLENDCT